MTDSSAVELFKLGGGIAGIIALGWRFFESFSTYIQIDLNASKEVGSRRVRFSTTIENKSHLGKRLDAAFLLIGPEAERPTQVARSLEKLYPQIGGFQSLNDMVSRIANTVCRDSEIASSGVFDGAGRSIIPLRYYYRENISVGDERLTCSCTVDQSNFPPGSYAVRFYVEPRANRLFRSVQTVFEILPEDPGARQVA